MKINILHRRTLALAAVIVPLIILLGYVAFRSGPMAPVAVTEVVVTKNTITPGLFGVGTVESRYTYKIGPTFAGRIRHLDVQVGDHVKAGQKLGEMDPVDLDARIASQTALQKRALVMLQEATVKQAYAQAQAQRYKDLLAMRATSEEIFTTKQEELQIADAALAAAREDLSRARSDRNALEAQRANLRFMAPADGIITARDADPGTTLVAGQTVIEMIDPKHTWVNVRFDQVSTNGLSPDLPAHIELRSRNDQPLKGRVLRLEPKADAITEEALVKVVFEKLPEPLPRIGELAEVTLELPVLPAMPVIPNAAVRHQGDQVGVWKISDGKPEFIPVKLGRADLDGRQHILEGIREGDRIIVYSEKAFSSRSRIKIVERIPGVAK